MDQNESEPNAVQQAETARHLLAEVKTLLEQLRADREAQLASGEAISSKVVEVNAAATAALAASSKITDDQAVVAQKSAHIQSAQEHADKVRAELDRHQTAATQQANEAEGQRKRAEAAADAAVEVLGEIRARKATAVDDQESIDALLDQSTTASATTKGLADKASTIEDRVAKYEGLLAELHAQTVAQLETITKLLPGATAAGLAHSFDDRRKTFLKPATRWQWLFVGSVVCLVALAFTGLMNVYHVDPSLSWDTLGRSWLARLPIAAALVWLALHSSRESALSKRLEEDYGYKAAIAASFQGFQKQMADIGSATPEGSPLSTLCANTLTTISSPPGRIYEKHQLTVTPAGELVAAATGAVKTKE